MYTLERYGEPIFPLPRKVVKRGVMEELSLELHPPRLRGFILSRDPAANENASDPPHELTLSIYDTVRTLCNSLKESFEPESKLPYRIWKVDDGELETSVFPISRITSECELLEETDKSLEDALIQSGDAFVVEFKVENDWDVTVTSSKALLEPPPLSQPGFFDQFFQHKLPVTPKRNEYPDDSQRKITIPSSIKPSPYRPMTRTSRAPEPGTIGLGNMSGLHILFIELGLIQQTQGQHMFHEFRSPVSCARTRARRIFFECV